MTAPTLPARHRPNTIAPPAEAAPTRLSTAGWSRLRRSVTTAVFIVATVAGVAIGVRAVDVSPVAPPVAVVQLALPAVASPTVPAVTQPATPAIASPTVPAVTQPATPAVASPTVPAVTQPATPAVVPPAAPVDNGAGPRPGTADGPGRGGGGINGGAGTDGGAGRGGAGGGGR